ncbi:MAG TPA: S41 family peptidase [Thermoanaerobaculia bacterium]|nr:S41 family peptidase [Thermoanaerobaculia bacterium]
MIVRMLMLALTLSAVIDRAPVLDRIGALLVERYVDEDAAKRCAAHLKNEAARFNIENDAQFAEAITSELRTVCDDRHFELIVQKPQTAPSAPEAPNAWIEPLRQRNNDFNAVRRLPGNVGYLELLSFPPPDVAGTTAAGAMNFLSATDAVIIDLRRNSGGTGDMVTFLATYFFERQTALANTIRRAQGTITADRTLPWVPGPRMTSQDLFILTSRGTFSAAEAFAFVLQSLKRATIVGEQTKGGGNAGRYVDVVPPFRLFVPNAHPVSAATGESWDKVGVKPDIAIDARDALASAHAEAVRRLIAKTKDAERKRELEWVLDALAPAPLPVNASELAGTYAKHRIRFDRGQLWLSTDDGAERALIPLANGQFAIEGIEHRRIEFRDRALVLHSSDGRDDYIERQPR